MEEKDTMSYEGLNPILAKELSHAESELGLIHIENLKLQREVKQLQNCVQELLEIIENRV